MMLIEGSQEGKSECTHLLHKDSSCAGRDIRNYMQLMREYLPYVYVYASANSCLDRLNMEGGRDPASRLTQTADKRRERATPAETDEQKQERLRKQRREIGADALLRLPMEETRTRQRECLAAETTADKVTRFKQMSALQHKLKGYHAAESATERDIRLQKMSTCQCERLAAETTPERDARFYC